MRPDLIVIGSVILQNATQLRFVEHDQVIEAFAPNRADEALDVAVLPGRARRSRMIVNPHRLNAMGVAAGAKLTHPGVGYSAAEDLMLVAEEAVEIRVLSRQGKSIRDIARMLKVSRNTVRRYLRV